MGLEPQPLDHWLNPLATEPSQLPRGNWERRIAEKERLRKIEVEKTKNDLKKPESKPLLKNFSEYGALTQILIVGGGISALALLIWSGRK